MQPMGLRFSDESLPAAYDRLFTPSLFEPWARVLTDLVQVKPGDAILDVATGPGTVARVAAMRAGGSGRVVGVDLSAPMLEVARSKSAQPGAAPIEFRQGTADDLQVSDASFDVVLCQQGLQFFPDQLAALREMRRSLKPGGRVGIAVWAKGYARDIEQILSECLRRVDAKAPTYPSFGTRLEDLTGALSEAGFVSIRSQDRTLEIRLGGGVEELLEGWGAGPMRTELLALDPERAQQFRDCLSREVLRFTRGGALITPSVARLAVASAPTRA